MINDVITEFSEIKKSYIYLIDAIMSNRYPYTIMVMGGKIGMHIPPKYRYGYHAYMYFIHNIKYYDSILYRPPNLKLEFNLGDLHTCIDPVEFLMKYRDDEILKSGYIFERNYDKRIDMINTFLKYNYFNYGYFILLYDDPKMYDNTYSSILYNDNTPVEIFYTVDELNKLIDVSKKKNTQFSQMSLRSLKSQILRKFHLWTNSQIFKLGLSHIVSKINLILDDTNHTNF